MSEPRTKYYYSADHHLAVMISAKNVMTYYQVKYYPLTGEFKHRYGKELGTNFEKLKKLAPDLEECNQEQFLNTGTDYYAKEKENGEKFKHYRDEQRAKVN